MHGAGQYAVQDGVILMCFEVTGVAHMIEETPKPVLCCVTGSLLMLALSPDQAAVWLCCDSPMHCWLAPYACLLSACSRVCPAAGCHAQPWPW